MNEEVVVEQDNLSKTIFEVSQEDYELLFEKFETQMKFKDYSIQEWNSILDLKDLKQDFSLNDLEKFTIKLSNQTNIIATNYAAASANYMGLKKSCERSLILAKNLILEEIENKNKDIANPASRLKVPSSEQLEIKAYSKISEMQLNLSIAEMFFHYWKINWERVNLLSSRLTSLSVLKNIESKNLNT